METAKRSTVLDIASFLGNVRLVMKQRDGGRNGRKRLQESFYYHHLYSFGYLLDPQTQYLYVQSTCEAMFLHKSLHYSND